MYCSRVCLSSQAYLSIVAETYAHTGTETGGIFLGKVVNDVWYVIEVLDPGYTNIQRRPGYFEYDKTYVTHLANVRARLYQNGLELLGLWHRHPGSFDSFSGTDDETHRRYTAQNPRRGAISALVNLDPHFRLTMYHIAPPAQHRRIQSVLIGDSHISSHLLAFKKPEELTVSTHSQTVEHTKKSWLGRFFLGNTDISETTPAQSEEITSPSASTATQQDQVLGMLEYELSEYLESQRDYDYDMQMHEDSVDITMQYIGSMTYYPLIIQCKFVLRNNEKRCFINNTDMLYTPGIIRQYVNRSIDDKMRGFDRQSIRTPQQESPTYATAVTQRQQRPTIPPTAASTSQRERAVDTPLLLSTQMPDKVLEMWRIEPKFLDERNDCTYEMQERDNSIEFMIKSVGKKPYSPREIHCKLFMDGDQKMCLINNDRHLYSDGIIQRHLSSLLPSG